MIGKRAQVLIDIFSLNLETLDIDVKYILHTGRKTGLINYTIVHADICFLFVDNIMYIHVHNKTLNRSNQIHTNNIIFVISDCGNLTDPVNGLVGYEGTTDFRTGYKSEAAYSCAQGFSLLGYTRRLCLASGKWSGKPPRCIKCKQNFTSFRRIVTQQNIIR